MALRSAHGEKPVGTVTGLEDTPEGVRFRASVFDSPAGDEYLANVRAGLNGVSVEAGIGKDSKRTKDGVILHRTARLHAIAGSVSPAYDSARIVLRDADLEGDTAMPDQTTEAQPEQRSAAERADSTVAAINAAAPVIQVTRVEGVYKPRGEHSFLRDAFLASRGDAEAAERQGRHNRMLADVTDAIERASDVLASEIPGMYANIYLPGLLTPRILKGRPMGGFFNRIAIADARPRIFAKVTTSGSVVTAADGAAFTATDVATTAVTVTPSLYGTYTDISRLAIDGGDPNTANMVLDDLYEAYAQASEAAIVTAVEGGATASGTAITAATPFAGVLGNVIAYQQNRFQPAEAVFAPPAGYTTLLSQTDSAGRPLIPSIGAQNSDGTVSNGGAQAGFLGANLALSWSSTVNTWVFAKRNDYVIYESPVASFSFDQAAGGPHAVRVGVWAYLGIGTRLGSYKKVAA